MRFQTKFMKENYEIFATFITENVNNMIKNSIFPDSLKQEDIKQVYKKDSRNEKKNYRPVSILSNLWVLHVYAYEQALWPYSF